MIRPREMTKVRIISHSRNIRNVIESLYELKVLHIIDFKKDEGFDIGKPLKEAGYYSQQLIDIRSAISRLGVTNKPQYLKNIKEAQKKFADFNKTFKGIVTKLDESKAEESRLAADAGNPLANLGITKDKIKEVEHIIEALGQEDFLKIAQFTLGDIDDYTTKAQREKILKADPNGGNRNHKVVKRK